MRVEIPPIALPASSRFHNNGVISVMAGYLKGQESKIPRQVERVSGLAGLGESQTVDRAGVMPEQCQDVPVSTPFSAVIAPKPA